MKIDLIVADDHPALIAGIEHALSGSSAIRVAGTASNSTELVDLLACEPCDILITDYAMPGGSHGDGLGLISFLRRHYPDLKIIVFTAIDNPALIASMARLGVRAVVNKMDHIDNLIASVQAVYAGATYIPADVDAFVSSRMADDGQALSIERQLSARELEIVRLYVSGLSVNEIAAYLHRSKQAVSTQKMNAMRKLGIERDASLFRFAYETGLMAAGVPSEVPVRAQAAAH
ncbi:response regulator transcription factor [Burkholderia oklahomensis]|uniref:response regulator transcription factor n=1 Tax=Burkholderia oklahomensis TaxID=342113 RepID=UPI00016A82F1|nr:response regulator transcription factor [Burkholderia oklahomensis]AJX34741.1 bacterial regulatory s, luxR family protein [Burkholderia oklahomensis C6786]AOI47937.1 LuxR family transcriptional regulator [Burkholderia oklahomensis C6786]KUY50192.1 LuxR family transcriptional regulator [Burkholderia oklahomensis C6786]MBI0363963.1 response regulator transcription factor [Burkholderia oklahomensis]SUY28151.1 Capsular synthesis regulator component B [Burkholderia oklahomensis]